MTSGVGPTRRAVLGWGALGIVGLAVGGAGIARTWGRGGAATAILPDAASAPEFAEPPVVASSGGVLDLHLRAEASTVTAGGVTATMLAYNGTVPGPTLMVKPGDTLRVSLSNGLSQATNLHTHGLQVSPAGNSDNPFVSVNPGESFDYEIHLPADHPEGVFWYHPHHHGHVADQVFAGLYGAIVVSRDASLPGRVVVVSDTTFAGGQVATVSAMESMRGRLGDVVLTNGQASPALRLAPGATERLLVVNACTSRYLDLDMNGETFAVTGRDGGAIAAPVSVTSTTVVPGGRATLVLAATDAEARLTARGYDVSMMGGGMMGGGMGSAQAADAVLLRLLPDASVTAAAAGADFGTVPSQDLRDATPARSRTLELGMSEMMSGASFTIDGRSFAPDRVDQAVSAGAVEEWTLTNTSGMDHPFHLHTWPMQIVSIDGSAIDDVDVRDVVDVPSGSAVVVRIDFSGNAGTTVYHCHILDHEDLGMMGIIEVA